MTILGLTGCENRLPTTSELNAAADRYCAKCRGLGSAMVNENTLDILCKDGTNLKMTYSGATIISLGECN